jgi:hypothetical protein
MAIFITSALRFRPWHPSGMGVSTRAAGPFSAKPEEARGDSRQNQDMQNVAEDMAMVHCRTLAPALAGVYPGHCYSLI